MSVSDVSSGWHFGNVKEAKESYLTLSIPPFSVTNAMIRTVFRVTGLGQGVSDDSDKQDPTSPSEDEGDPVRNAGLTVVSPDSGEVVLDDATQHLLLGTSTQHLPLPGAEQVFEADTGGGVVFSRERSKLTRGERIKMAKARRESGGGGLGLGFSTDLFVAEKRGIEKWGPGGEVVQELKDVIWEVGKQRWKMTDSQPPAESFPNVYDVYYCIAKI
jgi:hypothetical protein